MKISTTCWLELVVLLLLLLLSNFVNASDLSELPQPFHDQSSTI